MPIAKIWRNRVEAGTQILGNCPPDYYITVIGLIRSDFLDGKITKERLEQLVESGNITGYEYRTITEDDSYEN